METTDLEWITHREERTAHAVMWRSAEGPPFGYGTVCGYKSGAYGWGPAEPRDPKCGECRGKLALAARQKAEAAEVAAP